MQRLMSYMDRRHPFTETLCRNRIEIVQFFKEHYSQVTIILQYTELAVKS